MNRSVRKQINGVMRDELGGCCINSCEGPNDTELEFWAVNGSMVIVQVWPDDAGWCSYVSTSNKVTETVDQIRAMTA